MRYALVLSLLVSWAAPVAAAPSGPMCEQSSVQEQLHYLRRLSLDLRGHLPSVAEYEYVTQQGTVSAQQIDEMLTTEGFVERMRNYHRDLLWVNIGGQRLTGNMWRLSGPSGTSAAMWVNNVARTARYRGGRVGCADFESSMSNGQITTRPHPDPEMAANGVVQEGWVWVQAYWNPDQPVKVCAFDAQEHEIVDNQTNRGPAQIPCNNFYANRSSECGCGPNLRWCLTRDSEIQVRRSWDEQLLRFADAIVRGDRPYSELLTSREMEVNGPITHFLKHQTQAPGNAYLVTGDQGYDLPDDLGQHQVDEWRSVTRSSMHAGVLTLPSFLTKFQSNRGRATRFYHAFRCEAFQAPPGGLPATDDDCHNEPNLTKRCGCKYCHVSVEPAAAYWGRWSEQGIKPLIPEAQSDAYPAFDPACGPDGNQRGSLRCRLYYVNEVFAEDDARKPYEGYLRSYLFADDLGEQNGSYSANIESGPQAMAQTVLDPGESRFAKCTSQRIFKHFTGRDFRTTESALEGQLSSTFQTGFDLKQLVRQIVTSAEYREGARFGLIKEEGGEQ